MKTDNSTHGSFKDMVKVKATDMHPTMKAGNEYRVHSAHIPFLSEKGYIKI